MGRPKKPYSESLRPQILNAAAQLFGERGYEGTNLRLLAKRIGISAPSIYHHFESKEALLFAVLDNEQRNFLIAIQRAVDSEKADDPLAKLRSLVRAHVGYRVTNKAAGLLYDRTFKGAYPLRHALTSTQIDALVAVNQAYNDSLRAILSEGQRRRLFNVEDIPVTGFAIVAICEDVASWYMPSGRLSLDELSVILVGLVERIVGFSGIAKGKKKQTNRRIRK